MYPHMHGCYFYLMARIIKIISLFSLQSEEIWKKMAEIFGELKKM